MIGRKKYHQHKISENSIQEIYQNFIQMAPLNPDRTYMKEQMEDHIKYIMNNGIQHLSSFVKTLHKYRFSSGDQLDFIKYCSEQDNQHLLKKRELRKSNASEKNILLNVLALKHGDDFMGLIKDYVNDKFPEMINKDDLFHDFNIECKSLQDQIVVKNATVINDINVELKSLDDQTADDFFLQSGDEEITF